MKRCLYIWLFIIISSMFRRVDPSFWNVDFDREKKYTLGVIII